MSSKLLGMAVGVSAFALECFIAWSLLLALSFATDVWGVPGSDAARYAVAYAGLIAVVGASLVTLVGVPFALGNRLRANVWIALAVAGLLSGRAAHWLLQIVSIVNDCTVEVSVPYGWIHTCTHSR